MAGTAICRVFLPVAITLRPANGAMSAKMATMPSSGSRTVWFSALIRGAQVLARTGFCRLAAETPPPCTGCSCSLEVHNLCCVGRGGGLYRVGMFPRRHSNVRTSASD